MVRVERIFVDSNFFVALFNANDSLYKQSFAIAKNLDKSNKELVISNFVFLEIVTVLSQRINRERSIEAGKYLLENPNIKIHHIDEKRQSMSWGIFQNVKQKNVSFVDCSTIVLMKSEGMKTLLTFDLTDFKSLCKQFRLVMYEMQK
jgi:uncharacterized protein